MNEKRGIIISAVEHTGEQTVIKMTPDAQSLRYYLLYWDLIDFPQYESIKSPLGSDLEFLKSENILLLSNFEYASLDNKLLCRETISGTKFVFDGILPEGGPRVGSFPGPFLYELQIRQALAFKFRTTQSLLWSMGQTGTHLFVPELTATTNQVAEMVLYRALPVPPDDMSLVDVLEFKHARRDELSALRHALDNMYLNIVNSNDIPRQKNFEIVNLQRAINDLNSVANESWRKKLLGSLKVELNVPKLLATASVVEAAALVYGFPTGIGAAIGAIGAAIKFDCSPVAGVKGIPSDLKDYAYLLDIKNAT